MWIYTQGGNIDVIINHFTVTIILQLTGTVFSSCILYLRSAAGFPVRSRKMKKELLATYTIGGTREDPIETNGHIHVHMLIKIQTQC